MGGWEDFNNQIFTIIILQISIISLLLNSFRGMKTSISYTLFSQNLALISKKKGLSQDELGKKVGTIAITTGRYERGEIKPSIDISVKNADALEVSLDLLLRSSDTVLEKKYSPKNTGYSTTNRRTKKYCHFFNVCLSQRFQN